MTSPPPFRPFRFAPLLAATILTVLLLWLVGAVADVLLLLFVAILISLYLGALTDLIVRRTGLPRHGALPLAILATLAGIVGLVALLVPPVVEQTQQLIRVLPDYIQRWEAGIVSFVNKYPALRAAWRPDEQPLLGALYGQISGSFHGVVPRVFSLVHGVVTVFAVAVMSIYLTLQPAIYREWLIALFPPIHRDLVRDVLGDLATTLRAWIVAQLIGMTILAVLTAIGLYLLGVPYWLTFGVFTGAVAIVPFFGSLVSTILPALFVLGGAGGMTRSLLVVALGVVIHVIEANVVMPLITAQRVHLPPVLTMVAVLIAGKLLGPAGLLVAVPILASIMVVLRRILITRIYEGQGFRRTARDRVLVLRVPAPDGGVLVADAVGLDVLTIAERARTLRIA